MSIGTPVPEAWTRAMGDFRDAQVARAVMKDTAATQVIRDDATVRYSRAVDRLMDNLERLSEAHELGRITMLLARKDRR